MSLSSRERSTGAALGRPTQPSPRTLARVAGVFFVVTFVASIPALILYDPVLKHADYILGAGADTRIQFGALLEVIPRKSLGRRRLASTSSPRASRRPRASSTSPATAKWTRAT
jgi:hypothetical protein